MRHSVLRLVGIATAAAMVMSTSVASAATTATPAPAQVNPWQVLSMLNGGASTIAYGGAAAVAQDATQYPDQSPPVIDQQVPPPLPGAGERRRVGPLFFVLGAVAFAALVYLLLHKGHHHNGPNSPA